MLLDAGQGEFAEKGFAGARVDVIAARAGVNKQLISYYFGSKQGLYDAVAERRRALVAEFDTPAASLPELARRYARAFRDHPDIERIFLREMFDRTRPTSRSTPRSRRWSTCGAANRRGRSPTTSTRRSCCCSCRR